MHSNIEHGARPVVFRASELLINSDFQGPWLPPQKTYGKEPDRPAKPRKDGWVLGYSVYSPSSHAFWDFIFRVRLVCR